MTRATAALMVALGFVAAHAAALCASPPPERPAIGPILGIETVVFPGATAQHSGATALHWRGPFGRAAALEPSASSGVAGTRFEVWREPLWSGAPTDLRADGADIADARFVVDHPVTFAEAIPAALASYPRAYTIGFGLLVVVLLVDGGILHATILAIVLAGVRAFSPAWRLDSDPARYWRSASDILAGRLPDVLWPPGWPAALVPAASTGDPLWGRLMGVALFAVCPALAARVAGPGRVGVAAAVITAVSFEMVGFAPSLYSETLFVALGLGCFAMPGAGSAGVLAAAATLTRAHALLVFPAVAWTRAGFGRFMLVFTLPLLVWSAAPSLVAGRAILISDNGAMNLWIGHRPGADGDWHDPGPPPPEGYASAAVAAIRADPGAAAARVLGNVARLWNASRSDRTLAVRPYALPLLPFIGLVVMAAAGAWASVGTGRVSGRMLVLWLIVTTVATAAFFAPVRYKLGFYPALLPLAGRGLGWVVRRVCPLIQPSATLSPPSRGEGE